MFNGKYSSAFRYWVAKSKKSAIVKLPLSVIAGAVVLKSYHENNAGFEETEMMFYFLPYPVLVAYFLLFYVVVTVLLNIIFLLRLSYRIGFEVSKDDYSHIIKLLEDNILTKSEISKVTHNQMIFYEDYYELWLLAQKRISKNAKAENKQKLENDKATQLEEFNAVKQSLIEQLEDYDKPQEKSQ